MTPLNSSPSPSEITSRVRRAMTLVEILAVVVILGLVAGTLLVGFSGSFGKAKHELAKSGIGLIVGKIELYRIDKGEWPSNEQGLKALSDGNALPTSSYYLSADKLLDPWGKPYLYVTPGPDGHPYEVLSYGSDGQPGGASGGEEADLSSVNLRAETAPRS
jgi:general secretion pathway protein G